MDFANIPDEEFWALESDFAAEAQRRRVLKDANVIATEIEDRHIRDITALQEAVICARDGSLDSNNPKPWVQPSGAHDTYPRFWPVMYLGKAWKSKIANNTTVPGSDSRYWEDMTPVPTTPTISEWSPTTTYSVGDRVVRNGRIYQCLVAHGAEYQGTWGPPATGVWLDVGVMNIKRGPSNVD